MKALSSTITSVSAGVPAETRVAAYDWSALAGELDQFGCVVLPKIAIAGRVLSHCRPLSQGRTLPKPCPHGAARLRQGRVPLLHFNCLHQDLYGDLAFPIQVAILLSEPGKDFTSGEFVLSEQRPRMQSRPKWSRFGRATRQPPRSTIDRCGARKAIIA